MKMFMKFCFEESLKMILHELLVSQLDARSSQLLDASCEYFTDRLAFRAAALLHILLFCYLVSFFTSVRRTVR